MKKFKLLVLGFLFWLSPNASFASTYYLVCYFHDTAYGTERWDWAQIGPQQYVKLTGAIREGQIFDDAVYTEQDAKKLCDFHLRSLGLRNHQEYELDWMRAGTSIFYKDYSIRFRPDDLPLTRLKDALEIHDIVNFIVPNDQATEDSITTKFLENSDEEIENAIDMMIGMAYSAKKSVMSEIKKYHNKMGNLRSDRRKLEYIKSTYLFPKELQEKIDVILSGEYLDQYRKSGTLRGKLIHQMNLFGFKMIDRALIRPLQKIDQKMNTQVGILNQILRLDADQRKKALLAEMRRSLLDYILVSHNVEMELIRAGFPAGARLNPSQLLLSPKRHGLIPYYDEVATLYLQLTGELKKDWEFIRIKSRTPENSRPYKADSPTVLSPPLSEPVTLPIEPEISTDQSSEEVSSEIAAQPDETEERIETKTEISSEPMQANRAEKSIQSKDRQKRDHYPKQQNHKRNQFSNTTLDSRAEHGVKSRPSISQSGIIKYRLDKKSWDTLKRLSNTIYQQKVLVVDYMKLFERTIQHNSELFEAGAGIAQRKKRGQNNGQNKIRFQFQLKGKKYCAYSVHPPHGGKGSNKVPPGYRGQYYELFWKYLGMTPENTEIIE